jgi:hypothetical protein
MAGDDGPDPVRSGKGLSRFDLGFPFFGAHLLPTAEVLLDFGVGRHVVKFEGVERVRFRHFATLPSDVDNGWRVASSLYCERVAPRRGRRSAKAFAKAGRRGLRSLTAILPSGGSGCKLTGQEFPQCTDVSCPLAATMRSMSGAALVKPLNGVAEEGLPRFGA